MIKKKTKKKAVAKKTAKKKIGPKNQERNPAEVRKNIALMIEEQAATMAGKLIEVGNMGQLAQVKYLFEVAEIFPAPTDGSQGTQEEDSLARTLLNRLDLPDEPIVRDENGEVVKVKPVTPAADNTSASGEKDSCSTKAEEQKDAVLA
jgi:hypothetical protein